MIRLFIYFFSRILFPLPPPVELTKEDITKALDELKKYGNEQQK